ncbi:MAG: glucose-6-phosphate dehydrogenase [Mycobacteriales bacterium]
MTASTLAAALPSLATTGVDLVVLGATGDLAQRKLLPALAAAEARGLLGDGTRVLGLGRRPLDDDAFRGMATASLEEHGSATGHDARAALVDRLSYVAVDLRDRAAWQAVADALPSGTGRTRVFYLACAPDLFGPVCAHLAAVGLADSRSRVVLEKPLGTDLASAHRISDEVAAVFDERQIFRIDHYLGKETVQNLLVLRFGNAVFGPLWDARGIDHVQITVSETLGVGTRGGYYDTSGALRDMVQNHLLQLLCLVAMEPPARLDADGIRDAKVEVLRSLRPWTPHSTARSSVRGQYQGYLDECGNPGSTTETFVALRAEIDNWRWAGVPFYLRTGKRLARHASEIVVQLKDVPHWIFPDDAARPAPNQLVIGLQPDEVVHLELRAKVPGPGPVRLASKPLRLDLASAFPATSASAYERLLLDVVQDNPVLFMRRDEVEAAWAWVDPLLAAWRDGATPLRSYAPSSHGPSAAVELLARDGRHWHGEDL